MDENKIIRNLKAMDSECDNCKECSSCKYHDECFGMKNYTTPYELLIKVDRIGIDNLNDFYDLTEIYNLKYIESLDL